MSDAPKKVVLAYSGGLDTSIILKWLQTEYGCEVITFTADLGQGEELEPARAKANCWASSPRISTSSTCAKNSCATSSSRCSAPMPSMRALSAGHLNRAAADFQAPGRDCAPAWRRCRGTWRHRQRQRSGPFRTQRLCAGPSIKVIAPWREWDLTSRTKLIEFAEANQIPIAKDKRGEAPFSVDANLLHTSSEGKALENPDEAPDYVYQRTVSPEDAPDTPEYIEVSLNRATRWRSMA